MELFLSVMYFTKVDNWTAFEPKYRMLTFLLAFLTMMIFSLLYDEKPNWNRTVRYGSHLKTLPWLQMNYVAAGLLFLLQQLQLCVPIPLQKWEIG